jgi:hypothetical protein
LTSADEMYGPITTLRRKNQRARNIPWSAFKLTDNDWIRVVDARDILAVSAGSVSWSQAHADRSDKDSNDIQQYFSSEKQPMLWRALPALEELLSAWEKKRDSPRYTLYKDALNAGLDKLGKYYSRLDEKPSFILALGNVLLITQKSIILIHI